MYNIKAIFDKEPVVVAEAVKAVLAVLVIVGVVTLSAEALAAIVLAVGVVLALFVRNASVPAGPLAELAAANPGCDCPDCNC